MDAGARPADAGLPLLGRDPEFARVRAAIDADRAVALLGEAGIGKTSLIRTAVAASGRRLREGGGFATLHWLPYLALRRALGTGLGGDATSVAATVERLVGPDVLFVDDVQWVDDDTLAVLDLVFDRIMVVVAIRTGDVGSARAIERIGRAAVDRIELQGLSATAAESLVRRANPHLPAARTAAVVARAAGNPLLLEELALGDEPSPVLERALAGQLQWLPSEARHAVDLLAVAERGLARTVLGSGVDAAIAAGVVVDIAGELQIRHVLVAEAIRSTIDTSVLAALSREIANLVDDPVDRARHLAAAGERAAATTAALEGLDVVTDPRDRAALLAVAAETATPEASAFFRLTAARALDELSEWSSVVRVLAGDWVESEEQAVEREALLVHAHYALGELDEARGHLAASETAVPAPSDGTRRRAIEAATFLVNVDGDVERAVQILDAELTTGDGSDPDGDLSVLRTAILLLSTGLGDASMLMTGLDRAFAAGRYRTAADRARVIHYLLLMGATVEETLGFLLAQTDRFEAAGVGTVALEFAADAVRAAFLAGRLEEAIARGDDLAERPAPLRSAQASDVYRARALTLRGSFDRAAELLRTLASVVPDDFFGRGEVLAGQAELAYWSGRPSVAIDLAREALAIPAPVPVAHVSSMVTLAWARADLGLDPQLRPASAPTRSQAGAAYELEAVDRWHRGDLMGATDGFDRAAEAWAGSWETSRQRCQWAAGESVRRLGERAAAIERLTAVRERVSAIGFEPLEARIRRSLRLAGVRASATRTQVLAAGGLTARERELVSLVERGLTNLEIARRLGLGRPTVARILASAMTKLGVSSRGQLAAAAPD